MTVAARQGRAGEARAIAGRIAASGRLRLRHGPIDVILDLRGEGAAVAAAEQAVRSAFAGVLERLVAELPLLRAPAGPASPDPDGPVARRMMIAVRPHAATFITPMAAVAGAVADHLLAAALGAAPLSRALANNGGDIAVHLAPGESLRLGVAGAGGMALARIELTSGDGIGGVATSGWRGRSHSLGIADAVTVLAGDGAAADAAATLIANAVDLPGSRSVTRRAAVELAPDSDLGRRLVTVDVARLSPAGRAAALDSGLAVAEAMYARGLIRGAFLGLQGEMRVAGPLPVPGPGTEGETP